MAKAKSKKQYSQQWKNHVAEILYGPALDVTGDSDIEKRIRDSVTKLCGEIDEVAEILESKGVFNQE